VGVVATPPICCAAVISSMPPSWVPTQTGQSYRSGTSASPSAISMLIPEALLRLVEPKASALELTLGKNGDPASASR
jgi:hypothetical protein